MRDPKIKASFQHPGYSLFFLYNFKKTDQLKKKKKVTFMECHFPSFFISNVKTKQCFLSQFIVIKKKNDLLSLTVTV